MDMKQARESPDVSGRLLTVYVLDHEWQDCFQLLTGCLCGMQTRQDLHRRHAREREALESQTTALQQRIQTLQAAEKNQSAADSALQV